MAGIMKYKTLVVGIDIESTGAYFGKDRVILGAIIAMDPETQSIVSHQIFEPRENTFGRRIQKPDGTSTYKDIWKANGFEERCFDEFWAKNIPTLTQIQEKYDDVLSDDDESVAARINTILQRIEQVSEKLVIVSDTMAYDLSFVNTLLITHAYKPLYYSRDGKYRWMYHTSSYFLGLWGGDVTNMTPGDWNDFDMWMKDTFKGCPVEHDHSPENDAITIAWNFVSACKYNGRCRLG